MIILTSDTAKEAYLEVKLIDPARKNEEMYTVNLSESDYQKVKKAFPTYNIQNL